MGSFPERLTPRRAAQPGRLGAVRQALCHDGGFQDPPRRQIRVRPGPCGTVRSEPRDSGLSRRRQGPIRRRAPCGRRRSSNPDPPLTHDDSKNRVGRVAMDLRPVPGPTLGIPVPAGGPDTFMGRGRAGRPIGHTLRPSHSSEELWDEAGPGWVSVRGATDGGLSTVFLRPRRPPPRPAWCRWIQPSVRDIPPQHHVLFCHRFEGPLGSRFLP